MNKLVELLLERRGLDAGKLEAIESPEHSDLANIDALCERLHEIHDSRTKIVILPDYDMDGIMSGTVGYAGMSELGFNVELFIPKPSDGYGFDKPQVINRLLAQHPEAKVILTCDCGISCATGAQYAASKGLEVLVTDHHKETELTTVRPYATVTVDPCSLDEEYEHPEICGAHVLWQCLDHYARKYGNETEQSRIEKLRVFAGVGTVSDTMPVLYENRALLRDAIAINRETWEAQAPFKSFLDGACENYKKAFRGLYAACKIFADKNKLSDYDDVDEEFFGFYLAPTFNAVKRMDADMSRAFGVFFGDHPMDDMRFLFDLNEQRKAVVKEKLDELLAGENEYAPYCYISDAPIGVLGLLATKLEDANGLPCVVVYANPDGSYSGSGRSPEWYPFNSQAASQQFKVAGHEGAFGCSFDSEDELQRLFSYLSSDVPEYASRAIESAPSFDISLSDGSREADSGIDMDLLLDFIEAMEGYRPFGRGFEPPVVALEFDMEHVTWRTMGKDRTHLKFVMPEGLDVICWGAAHYGNDGLLTQDVHVTLSGKLSVNEFRGVRKAQFIGDIVALS